MFSTSIEFRLYVIKHNENKPYIGQYDVSDSTFVFFRFRLFCNRIINHSYFANSVLVCILVSSASLAMENPLQADSDLNQVELIIKFS